MRTVIDAADLVSIHKAGVGVVHNPNGQVLHAATCEYVGLMEPRRKLFFAAVAGAEKYLNADATRSWAWSPDCSGALASPLAGSASPSAAVHPPPAVGDYVPYEPRTDDQRALKAALRNRIGQLTVARGHLIHAQYRRKPPPGSDVENVLLYNIAGPQLTRVMAGKVRFELGPEDSSVDAYDYGVAPIDAGFAHWREDRELARFADVEVATPTLAAFWWALRPSSGLVTSDAKWVAKPFTLRLVVDGPVPGLTPELVKGLSDGWSVRYRRGSTVRVSTSSPIGSPSGSECPRWTSEPPSWTNDVPFSGSSQGSSGCGSHTSSGRRTTTCASPLRFCSGVASPWRVSGPVCSAHLKMSRQTFLQRPFYRDSDAELPDGEGSLVCPANPTEGTRCF